MIVLLNCPACGEEVGDSSRCACEEQELGAVQEAGQETMEVWTRRKKIPVRRRKLTTRARERAGFGDTVAGAVGVVIVILGLLVLEGFNCGDPLYYVTWGPVPYVLGLSTLLFLCWRWINRPSRTRR